MTNYKKLLVKKMPKILRARNSNLIVAKTTVADKKPLCDINIIQTGCYGDNMISTLMLKPIRNKYENNNIVVHTSTLYASAFYNNPYIDKLVEYQSSSKNEALNLTLLLLEKLKDKFVISKHPMFCPDSWTSIKHGELGTSFMCSWIRGLEDHDIPYELPLELVLNPYQCEIDKIDNYYNSLPNKNSYKVLMEVHGESGQSQWDCNWTMVFVERFLSHKENSTIFISKREFTGEIKTLSERYGNKVVFVGDLSLRECACLFNKCDMFISVSSGLSNYCNSNYCKKDIKWFEVVNSEAISSRIIRTAGKEFWYYNNLDGFVNLVISNC